MTHFNWSMMELASRHLQNTPAFFRDTSKERVCMPYNHSPYADTSVTKL